MSVGKHAARRGDETPDAPADASADASADSGALRPGEAGEDAAAQTSILTSSAVMAAGTVVSRMSGFVRNALLAAALGTQLHADVFTIANTIPNMLYILLAGGVFNAVLVPQLVRAMRNDADGGAAYTNRVITLSALFLLAVTAVLVVAAPLVMRVLLDPQYFTSEFAAQRESIIDMAVNAGWLAPEDEARHLGWTRAFYRDLFADTGGVPVPGPVANGTIINHPDADLADPTWNTSGVPWSTLYFKDNYPRLQRVKARWDPRDVFRHALGVRPADER